MNSRVVSNSPARVIDFALNFDSSVTGSNRHLAYYTPPADGYINWTLTQQGTGDITGSHFAINNGFGFHYGCFVTGNWNGINVPVKKGVTCTFVKEGRLTMPINPIFCYASFEC